MLYAASYQLNKPKKNYQPLWDAFGALDAHKAMNDFYLIDNTAATQEVGEYLRQFIDDDDFLVVVPFVDRPYKYRCFKGTQDWLDARF
jgi:hypothetical protein